MSQANQLLLDKFKKRELAPFYLLRFEDGREDSIKSWIENLMERIYGEQDLKFSWSAADVLWIAPSEGKANYLMDDLQGLTNYLEYNHIDLDWRFIFISQAQKLSVAIQNKLLKTLESPGERTSLILMSKQDAAYLPTVLSRAIIFHIAKEKSQTSFDRYLNLVNQWPAPESNESLSGNNKIILASLYDFLNNQTHIGQCLEKLRENRQLLRDYFLFFTNWIERNALDYNQQQFALDIIKNINRDFSFHNTLYAPLYDSLNLMQSIHIQKRT